MVEIHWTVVINFTLVIGKKLVKTTTENYKSTRFGKCTYSKFENSMTNGGCAVVMNNYCVLMLCLVTCSLFKSVNLCNDE